MRYNKRDFRVKFYFFYYYYHLLVSFDHDRFVARIASGDRCNSKAIANSRFSM